jgi:PAS domain S-box-containing protein
MRTSRTSKTGRNKAITRNFSKAGTSLFPAILDTLEEPFFLFDDKFKMAWYNKACNELYQYVSGKPIDSNFDFNELLTKEQQPLFYDHLNKVLTGEKVHFEWRYKLSVTKWLSVSLYPFTSDNGKFIGICGSLRDITEKKINDLVLLRNTAVLNNISDAVIYTDLEQRVIYFNKNAESIYGITSHEITDHLLSDFIRYEYMDDTKEKVLQIISKKGNWEGKIVYTRKDGKKMYMLAAITWLADKNQTIIGMIITNKDITQEELNRQQSFRHQDNINAIISNITEGVLLVDSDFTILEFNQMAYTLEKRIDTELRIGEDLVDMMPEYRKKPVRQYLELALKGKLVEYEVLYPDNTWLLVNFIPVRNKTGNIKQISITFRDITERKQAEQVISANEKKYRTLVNSLSEGVILQTLDNKILTVNKSAERILGLSVNELIQKGFPSPDQSIIDEKEKRISHEQLFFRKSGKISYVKNKVIGLRENGSTQWLRLNSAGVGTSRDNEINAVVISFEDITEQKRISGEMEVLSMVAKKTDNAVCILDINGEVKWVNEGFTKLTGYSPDEIIGTRSRPMFIGPGSDVNVFKKMTHLRENGLPFKEEVLRYSNLYKREERNMGNSSGTTYKGYQRDSIKIFFTCHRYYRRKKSNAGNGSAVNGG